MREAVEMGAAMVLLVAVWLGFTSAEEVRGARWPSGLAAALVAGGSCLAFAQGGLWTRLWMAGLGLGLVMQGAVLTGCPSTRWRHGLAGLEGAAGLFGLMWFGHPLALALGLAAGVWLAWAAADLFGDEAGWYRQLWSLGRPLWLGTAGLADVWGALRGAPHAASLAACAAIWLLGSEVMTAVGARGRWPKSPPAG